jgi:hypothetical protein
MLKTSVCFHNLIEIKPLAVFAYVRPPGVCVVYLMPPDLFVTVSPIKGGNT